jgi:hypothetical protein
LKAETTENKFNRDVMNSTVIVPITHFIRTITGPAKDARKKVWDANRGKGG